MVKILGAFAPAVMISYLAGLVVKKVNARGAVTGVITGTISGVLLIVLNGVLLSVYKDDVATNPTLSYWLKQAFNSVSIAINIVATVLGLWLGSRFSKTPEEERVNSEAFFKRMSVSASRRSTPDARSSRRSAWWDCRFSSTATIFFIVIAVMAVRGNSERLGVNLTAAALVFLSGALFRWHSKRKKTQAA